MARDNITNLKYQIDELVEEVGQDVYVDGWANDSVYHRSRGSR